MRKASLWLLSGFVIAAVAAFAVAHVARAEEPVLPPLPLGSEFTLRSFQDGFPLGGLAELEVSVPPHAVGGFAHLYATVGPETHYVMTFPVHAPLFPITTPVPPAPPLLGQLRTYSNSAFSPEGIFLAKSSDSRNPIVDPSWD
ncbi:MAG: hypothetical protein MUE73_16070 [Planctomycetes bacterium]|nr:hypothetical protein [Planctomycetota bacterium]